MLNNNNTVGTGMDGLLGSSLGLNLEQLAAVREMVTEKRGSADRSAGGGKAWSETGEKYQVGKTPKGMGINNNTNVISTIGKRGELREILEELSLDLYES